MRARREKNSSSRVNLPGARGSASISMLTVVWYLVGALVLGILLAKWSWILLKSPATVAAIVPEHDESEDAGKLFGAAAEGSSSASPAAALPDAKLVGVFAPDSGRSGFAVLKLDEQHQVGVVTGEDVAPGVRLLEVHADHVVLERSGVRQKVELVNTGATTGIVPAGH